jgi:hypothetical protein
MKKWILLIIGIFVLFIAFGILLFFQKRPVATYPAHAQAINPRSPHIQKISGIPTTYVGTLPCAGCTGLKTKLTLYRNIPTDTTGQYDLQTTAIGTNGQITEVQGKWKTVTGDNSDTKATVFEVMPINSSDIRYFQRVDASKISMLSKQMVEIKSANYTLTKQ